MTASHPQYFIVTDSISPHSNSQQLTVIHCDEPNTGFEPRLISAHFFARWSGWRLLSINDITIPENVNKIESGAFSGCESLKKITILNSECVIEDTPTTICNIYDYDENFNETAVFNGTIYGYDNSTAQKYAEKYGYNFVSIGKAYIIGDCNDDGTMNIADVVTLQQFLLGNGGLAEWRNADLCKDERIDVFDMVLMRRLLIERMYYYDSWY